MIERTKRLGAAAFLVGIVAAATALWPPIAKGAASTPQEAEAKQQAGDWAGAAEIWRNLAQSHPDDYILWNSLGIALAHQNRFEKAIDAYHKALQLRPQIPQTQLNLGLAYFKSGDLDGAIAPLQQAARGLPENAQVELLLGMCFYGKANYPAAIPHLRSAENKLPDNHQLRLVIAQAYLWSGQYEGAKQEFQSLLASDPESPQVQMLLGEALDGLQQTEDAVEAFRKAAAGQLPDAHFGLGYLLWKLKRYPEAATEFQRELALTPGESKSLAYLGDTELLLGDNSAAERDLRRSAASHDAPYITHFDLGKIEAQRKQPAAALKEFQQAITLEPNRPEAHYRAAQMYQSLGMTKESRHELAIVGHLHQKTSDDLVLKISGDRPDKASAAK